MLKYYHQTIHKQGNRPNQEDSVFPELGRKSGEGIFIVCDGLGGHDAGEVASAAVCDALGSHPELPFEEALSLAYDALDARDNGSYRKMGTTLAYLRISGDSAFVAHIGDSRVYHIRPSEKRLMFVTRDHSLINELVSAGEISPEEALFHPDKNVITRAMQPNGERVPAEVDLLDDVRPGDWFFVCSDGMLEFLEDDNIVNILSMQVSDKMKLRIFLSIASNSRDNYSAQLVRIGEEKGEFRTFIQKTWPFIKYQK